MQRAEQEMQVVSAISQDLGSVVAAAINAGIPPMLIITAMDVATSIMISTLVRPESWDTVADSHARNIAAMLNKYRERDALDTAPKIITEL